MGYELRPVRSAADWQAMHDIRRATLFTEERHPGIVYDENHPLDHHPDNQPFVLMFDGRAIGVVRLDRRGRDQGIVRLVAVAPGLQRRGHGRALEQLIEAEARRRGMGKLMLNAHVSAIGFYERTGWHREKWDSSDPGHSAGQGAQMVKTI